MAQTILRRGPDNLLNGTLVGAAAGALIHWGADVETWLLKVIPESWQTFAGADASVPIIVIGAGALIGYIMDRW